MQKIHKIIKNDESENRAVQFPTPPKDVVLQTDMSKCWNCYKKIGLLGFDCKCGYKFCGLHRHPEQHSCSYDFKTSKLNQLNDKLTSYALQEQKINRI